MKRIALATIFLGTLAACGPMPPERAADLCEERARRAAGPTGEFVVGVGNRGAGSHLEVGVTSDYLQGRDPHEVYENCVREKTGQGPIRPLDLGESFFR